MFLRMNKHTALRRRTRRCRRRSLTMTGCCGSGPATRVARPGLTRKRPPHRPLTGARHLGPVDPEATPGALHGGRVPDLAAVGEAQGVPAVAGLDALHQVLVRGLGALVQRDPPVHREILEVPAGVPRVAGLPRPAEVVLLRGGRAGVVGALVVAGVAVLVHAVPAHLGGVGVDGGDVVVAVRLGGVVRPAGGGGLTAVDGVLGVVGEPIVVDVGAPPRGGARRPRVVGVEDVGVDGGAGVDRRAEVVVPPAREVVPRGRGVTPRDVAPQDLAEDQRLLLGAVGVGDDAGAGGDEDLAGRVGVRELERHGVQRGPVGTDLPHVDQLHARAADVVVGEHGDRLAGVERTDDREGRRAPRDQVAGAAGEADLRTGRVGGGEHVLLPPRRVLEERLRVDGVDLLGRLVGDLGGGGVDAGRRQDGEGEGEDAQHE